jgi:exodeoxyribonuclease V gamma subunit
MYFPIMPADQFNLYTSSRLEELAHFYLQNRRKTLARYRADNIFIPENVTVASRGMWTWLEEYLVKQGETVANFDAPFINRLITDILAKFYGEQSGYDPTLFSPGVLRWRIYRLLTTSTFITQPAFTPLRNYIGENADAQLRASQLSEKLARLYFNYCAYLPEQLENATLDNGGWQSLLWQALCKQSDGTALLSPAKLLLKFINREFTTKPAPELLTPITVFGISAMPPIYLQVLGVYSEFAPVNFYYLNPSCEDWSTQSDDRHCSIEELREKYNNPEINNTLLGNLGLQGREFFKALLDDRLTGSMIGGESADCELPPPQNLLQSIQDCVLRCSDEPLKSIADDNDDSLSFHSCANAVREIEVLQDCLLKLLTDANKSKSPEERLTMNDIVVMAPNISNFAPLIRAVFDNGPLKNRYCITDRSIKNANQSAEVFLTILSLHQSRFELSRISALLDYAPLRQRYDLTDKDAALIHDWLIAANVRWSENGQGTDALPPAAGREFTWEYGLDRLLLNIALEGDGTYDDMPPIQLDTSADSLRILGALNDLYHNLAHFAAVLRDHPQDTIDNWCELLLDLRSKFFSNDAENAGDYAAIGHTISELRRNITSAYADAPESALLAFDVIYDLMASALEQPAENEPFLDGRITFCSLLPMRSIPCKVIALLGMDEGAFPRQDEKLNFNLVLKLRDDQSRRSAWLPAYACSNAWEDRYTFLEAILSARKKLLVFYNGYDDSTGEELPMAVPAADLRDYAKRLRGGKELKVIVHRLNAADPLNFANQPSQSKLSDAFSYDKTSWLAAQITPPTSAPERVPGYTALAKQSFEHATYQIVPRNAKYDLELTIDELDKFLRYPAEFFLRRTLSLPRAEWYEAAPEDCEPFMLDDKEKGELLQKIGLHCQSIPQEALPQVLKELYAREKASGNLPPGQIGEMLFEEVASQYTSTPRVPIQVVTDELAADFTALIPELPSELVTSIQNAFGVQFPQFPTTPLNVHLTGKITHLPPTLSDAPLPTALGGLHTELFAMKSNFKQSQLIKPYIEHLLLCANSSEPVRSIIIPYATDSTEIVFEDSAKDADNSAHQQLSHLITAYILSTALPLPLIVDHLFNFAPNSDLKTAKGDKFTYHGLDKLYELTDKDFTENPKLEIAFTQMAQYCFSFNIPEPKSGKKISEISHLAI